MIRRLLELYDLAHEYVWTTTTNFLWFVLFAFCVWLCTGLWVILLFQRW